MEWSGAVVGSQLIGNVRQGAEPEGISDLEYMLWRSSSTWKGMAVIGHTFVFLGTQRV